MPAFPLLATLRERSDLAVPLVIWICIAHAMWSSPLAVNHDVALNLSMAQKILDGQVPYVDFVEINPPLVMYLNIPPNLIGGVLGVNPIIVFNLLSLGLCIWSALSIRRTMLALELPGRGVVLAAWAGLAWFVHSTGDFGQREQHFMLAYIPFLLIRAARWSGRPIPWRRAIALGVMAGLMTALKPQFVIAAIIPELYWLARHRRAAPLKAPESLAAIAVGCAYLLHFVLLPSLATAYFGSLPELMHGYAAFKAPWTQLADPHLVVWPAAAVCLALLGRSLDAGDPASEIRLGLAVFTAAAFLFIYMWPRVIFPYHFEPARHGSILIVALMLAGAPHRMPRAIGAVVAVATLAFAASVIIRNRAATGLPPRAMKLAAFIESHTKPGESVMWFSCAVPPAYPLLVQIERRNASRYSFLAITLGSFNKPQLDETGRLVPTAPGPAESRFVANVREDMARARPNVLIVVRECMSWNVPVLFHQIGLMQDVFGDFAEVDITTWGNSLAPFVVYQRASSR